jgi:hypothetical protein
VCVSFRYQLDCIKECLEYWESIVSGCGHEVFPEEIGVGVGGANGEDLPSMWVSTNQLTESG